MKTTLQLLIGALAVSLIVQAQASEPRTNSWLTTYSGKYARIYATSADQTSGTGSTTWSRNSLSQSLPAYCGVQEVYSSADWVYIRTTGLGSHTMGPWYLDTAKTQLFPNLPVNKKALYRIPRNPTVPSSKTLTGLGAIGYFVDGVAMFDGRDAFYWNGSSEVNGSGNWNRDAYVNETPSFDPAYAHQEQTGQYHYHANPIAVRYLLGDNVTFNSATKTYSESSSAPTKHSPIIGWVRDGYPVYGPYGYSSAMNANSGVRRMVSGYVLRNGQNGSDNLTTTGRTSLPAWATRLYGAMTTTGPSVTTRYPLGRYLEDNAYLGDLGKTQGVDFDLDEYNGRYCVTPEFPNGTYAYFVSISSTGASAFPYNVGRAFYGNPTGNSVTSISETVSTNYLGGPNSALQLNTPTVNQSTVTLVWSSVEGGTYKVDSSTDQSTWNSKVASMASQGLSTTTNITASGGLEYARVTRTALASFDTAGLAATVAQTATQSFSTVAAANPPTISVQPSSRTVTAGANVSITVLAGGGTPLSYQWQKDGQNLSDGHVTGSTTSSIYIANVAASDAGSYAVIVSNSDGSVTSSAAVLTVNSDTTSPTVTISSPTANSTFTSSAITLSGTATDNIRLSQVLVSLNAGTTNSATLTLSSLTSGTWSIPLTLVGGNNTVSVQAVDASGNVSAVATASYYFKSAATLTIVTNGNGRVTVPSGTLIVGSNYTVTATAGTRWLFSNWVNSVTGETIRSNRYTFTMREALTLTANFVTNNFYAAAGTYYGLFSDSTNGVGHENAGFFRVTVSAGQRFSGFLMLEGNQVTISGAFDVSGYGTTTKPVTRPGRSTISVTLQLPFDDGDTISGIVASADEGWSASMRGNRSPFSGANPASSYVGKYTMLFPGFADPSVGPNGDGFATITVSTSGSAAASGVLGDGQTITPVAAQISKSGDWPFYALAYRSVYDSGSGLVRTYNGSIQGWLHLSSNASDATFTGDLFWNKTSWTDGFYNDGFSGQVIPLGSVYIRATAPNTRSLYVTNGLVTLINGNLSSELADTVTISSNNVVTFTSKNTGGHVTFNPVNGRISGTFTNPVLGNVRAPLNGVYLQSSNLNYIGGYFMGTNQSGEFRLQSN